MIIHPPITRRHFQNQQRKITIPVIIRIINRNRGTKIRAIERRTNKEIIATITTRTTNTKREIIDTERKSIIIQIQPIQIPSLHHQHHEIKIPIPTLPKRH